MPRKETTCADCGVGISAAAIRCRMCSMRRNQLLSPAKLPIGDRALSGAEKTARYRKKHPERALATAQTLRAGVRAKVNAYKSERGCEDCGNSDHRVLDLHHKDEKEKLMAVSSMRSRRGWLTVKAEMEKCRVLCANCHRIEHAESRASGDVTMQVAAAGFYRAS